MEMNDENIWEQFLQEQKRDLPDKGFSRHVMRSLPSHRQSRFLHFLSAFFTIIGVFIFLAYDGLQIIIELIRNIFVTIMQHNGMIHVDLKTFLIIFIVVSLGVIYATWQKADI